MIHHPALKNPILTNYLSFAAISSNALSNLLSLEMPV
jgi:hypothetical protein